jgi:cytochrome c oxidase cbb3-type subunit 1
MEATYNYKVVRQFAIMTVVWGIVGMLVGVIIAAQLIWPTLTEALGPLAPYLSYGRLRPLHTNAVIFAFGGSALFATSLYVVQRTCQTRLLSDGLAGFVFWGWQLIILLAAITLPLGIHLLARNMPSWNGPSIILITVVWVAYAVLVLRYDSEAQNKADLCCQLVLWRLHRHHRPTARRQQH